MTTTFEPPLRRSGSRGKRAGALAPPTGPPSAGAPRSGRRAGPAAGPWEFPVIGFGDAAWRALGTGVRLLTADPAALGVAREAVLAELDAIDRAASRFRPDSEVSTVAGAGGQPVPISALLVAAIAAALRAARLTGGAVDPTLGSTLSDLGYDRDFAAVSAAPAARPSGRSPGAAGGHGRVAGRTSRCAEPGQVTVRRLAGWRSVELDPAGRTVRVPPGTMLDLGATAKAFAADRAARSAVAAAGCGVLVSLGGDIAVAGEPPAGGWRVWVTDDHAALPGTGIGQQVTIASGGLATSSSTVRRWRRYGQDLHHLVDPTTCSPVDSPYRTVSVAAGNCLDANVASAATIVLAGAGASWLARTGLAGRLVRHSGAVHRVGDWPRERT
jgi:thiamine biosynthesis lipoprotein